MDEKGAIFHFHNLPLELKKILKRYFLFFSPFPLLDKRKSVATLAIRNNYDKMQNKSQFSHRITELATLLGITQKWSYLGAISPLIAFIV